ncbi:hypothetical protein D9M72_324250 [compost metagenome]
MADQLLQTVGLLAGIDGVEGGCQGQRCVEVILGLLREGLHRPQQRLHPRHAVHGRGVIARHAARLQLAYPVLGRCQRQARCAVQVRFESRLVEQFIVETAESRGLPAQRADQRQLRADEIHHQAEAHLLRIGQALSGLLMHLRQRFAEEQHIGDMAVAGIGGVRQVADAVGRDESSVQQFPALAHGAHPARHEHREAQVGSRFMAIQAA